MSSSKAFVFFQLFVHGIEGFQLPVSRQARWTAQRSLFVEASSDGTSGEADSRVSISRRSALGRAAAGSATAAWAALAAGSAPQVAQAVGPVNMELNDWTYETAECPPALKAGRIGGAFGGAASKEVTQQCVKVTATAINPTKSPLKECAVFGFVLDEAAGASVIANNPDLRSDSGQFAQIDVVPPGENKINFYFVATLGKDRGMGLPKLTFKSLKAISYPGGARFASLSPCELDSLSDECDEQDEENTAALRAKKMRY